jgi:mannose-1-phosphate guanylyltransferase
LTWNSGIFLFKAKNILEEIKKFSPEILKCCEKSILKKLFDLDFQRLDKQIFGECPNISIDYAVMEKTDKGVVLPMDVGWSDVGDWQSMWKNSQKDKHGNSLNGEVILDQTKNSLFRSESRLIVGLGVEDLIVVETNDVMLVANKKKSQDIKKIVNKLKENGISEGYEHKTIYRPWGHYISVLEELRWKVKVIIVKPGQTLSLQMHQHRSEHWVVVKGTAKVEIDEKKIILHENQSSYIPLGSKHRLSNPGKVPLKLIEVQSGSYVGEDDIKRFEDNYGRVEN